MNGTALPQACGAQVDVDVKRIARLLVDWHGPGAATRARWRAEDRRKSKAATEYAVWLQVECEIRQHPSSHGLARGNYSAAG